jgi:hypothetical protein
VAEAREVAEHDRRDTDGRQRAALAAAAGRAVFDVTT